MLNEENTVVYHRRWPGKGPFYVYQRTVINEERLEWGKELQPIPFAAVLPIAYHHCNERNDSLTDWIRIASESIIFSFLHLLATKQIYFQRLSLRESYFNDFGQTKAHVFQLCLTSPLQAAQDVDMILERVMMHPPHERNLDSWKACLRDYFDTIFEEQINLIKPAQYFQYRLLTISQSLEPELHFQEISPKWNAFKAFDYVLTVNHPQKIREAYRKAKDQLTRLYATDPSFNFFYQQFKGFVKAEILSREDSA
ncbi:MAG: hypothetical protein AAF206_23820 [Bacteroidota bacterium]